MKPENNPYGVAPNSGAAAPTNYAPIKNNGLAITALILGILSLFMMLFSAIPGVITGHMALSKIKKAPHENEGRGMAITGLVISYVMLVISLVFVVWIGYMVMTIPGFEDAFKEGFQKGATGQY